MTSERTGLRREANQMGMISELLEKHPEIPRSRFDFSVSSTHGVTAHLNCWGTTRGEAGGYLTVEEEMLKWVELFGPAVKWERNDPTDGSYNETYYQMEGDWAGITGGHHTVRIRLLGSRSQLCERVVTMSHVEKEMVPDPELVKDIPLKEVEVVKEIVEWQCNKALSGVNL